MSHEAEVRIVAAETGSVLKSLELVFGDVRQMDRHLRIQSLLVDELPREGVLEARRERRLVGAILAVVQPGKTGLLWPPRLVEGEPPETANLLLEAVGRLWTAAGVSMAYTALEVVQEADDRLFCRHGYSRTATVLYLASGQHDFPPVRPESALDFEPYCEANRARLSAMIEATYEQTRDCPSLRGVRNVEDVLEGYRQSGEFDPNRWLLVRHHGDDVGCLIVADHPEHGCCELVYLGLDVSARGHGWGKQIARYAQWLTARACREQLVVAVDAANEPAVDLYTSVGFRVWDRRVIYVKLLRPDKTEKGGE